MLFLSIFVVWLQFWQFVPMDEPGIAELHPNAEAFVAIGDESAGTAFADVVVFCHILSCHQPKECIRSTFVECDCSDFFQKMLNPVMSGCPCSVREQGSHCVFDFLLDDWIFTHCLVSPDRAVIRPNHHLYLFSGNWLNRCIADWVSRFCFDFIILAINGDDCGPGSEVGLQSGDIGGFADKFVQLSFCNPFHFSPFVSAIPLPVQLYYTIPGIVCQAFGAKIDGFSRNFAQFGFN